MNLPNALTLSRIFVVPLLVVVLLTPLSENLGVPRYLLGVAIFVAAALTVLPGFAPEVEASVPHALAKADRLDIRPVGRDCSQQAWPNFEASCLRVAGTKATSKSMIREARLVTADRNP